MIYYYYLRETTPHDDEGCFVTSQVGEEESEVAVKMSELEQLRQEAEQLKNQIRVRKSFRITL